MPVSHIGLTVSHLPTSCSFFLAALAPLGYRYIGQSGNQIGFGIHDTEFFISQETESIKATSAHVAFLAPSRSVVDKFFIAALKAGGRIHGEPAERDPATGYYSAAVLDLDDNSIEVMHRDGKVPHANSADRGLDADRVSSWQKEVAASTVSQAPLSTRASPRVTVTTITKPTIMVSDRPTQSRADNDMSSKTFIGTLLGAAAGAAVAYAMTKGDEGSNKALGNITYQAVEVARSHLAPSAAASRISHPQSTLSSPSQREPAATEYPRSQLSIASHAARSDAPSSWHNQTNRLAITAPSTPAVQASTLIDTFVPPSEVPRYRRRSMSRSKTDGAVPSLQSSRASSQTTSRPKLSCAHSSTKTMTKADLVPSRHSSIVTEFKHPREVPLPASKASSVHSKLDSDLRRMVLEHEHNGDAATVLESVAPSDSISQAGSKRSKGSKRESQYSSRTSKHREDEQGSQASEKTIKAEKSRGGSRRPSIMSLPNKPSSRTSVHRSVVSFLPVQRLLNDKLYDKRKQGALDLERIVREASANGEHDRIARIVHQLCHDYAYAVHQPHARNGGLIGLAAASIALGSEEVAKYLKEIVPPVLACFSDQDARVRYYACESMYNIAKVAKGEILLFFNDVFDALCKLAADAELSVKNGAELLDRLVKDIVSESAATYVSILHSPERISDKDSAKISVDSTSVDVPTAFSLAKFIPLLQERIYVLSPFTRTFLVSWVTLLDTIPDLELVYYLPAFLGGLFKFLSDPNRDVHVATQGALERFLTEIKKIARIKRGIEESRKGHSEGKPKASNSSDSASVHTEHSAVNAKSDIADGESGTALASHDSNGDGDWVPGQDVQVDHAKILSILTGFLDSPSEEETKTALRWVDNFFEVCPDDLLAFVPSLLSKVLPAMASEIDAVRQTANRLNSSLMDFIVSLPDESSSDDGPQQAPSKVPVQALKDADEKTRRASTTTLKSSQPSEWDSDTKVDVEPSIPTTPPAETVTTSAKPAVQLDYAAAVGALTLHFLNEHEATRVASLAWLIMLHRRAPGKVLATNDGTFPALLKTLSDPAEAVVTRDLQLLSQISKNSDDSYFNLFMTNLLQLFCTDRRLLETRCNLIIRQLCVSLSAERIYRTLADCLEKDEDLEFASIMVQNLNNNLITAPELADLRKRLRNLETRDGQTFFVTLFRSWCHNAVATFSLCLLAQAYEQAYNLLQIFAELEMTVNMLIQIDKLVQLLESPVFTYLRLQLLEPEKYPHLYKCLYGLLMLLPQSSAFAALKNRLNSVSAIGYLHIAPRAYVFSSFSHVRQKSTELKFGSTPPTPTAAFDRPNRLKAREEGAIRWVELLDKFKAVQERARRANRNQANVDEGTPVATAGAIDGSGKDKLSSLLSDGPKQPGLRPSSAGSAVPRAPAPIGPTHKPKSSLGNLGRFTSGVGGKKGKK
ncbi:MAG: hypothetical protein Q9209_000438 [Squamulea sp. 1 TL-2023]